MIQLRTSVLVAVLLSCVMACGGDDDDDDMTGNAGTKAPTSDAGTVDGGGGGEDIGPSGPGDEGAPCDAANKCNAGFQCVKNVFTVGICARPCSDVDMSKCTKDEVCFGYTDAPADQHCTNIVTGEYDLCGVALTSVCNQRSCLYFPNLPIGVCVDICDVGAQVPDAGVGGDDMGDGGPAGATDGLAMCRPTETCIDGIVDSPRAGEGVCGTLVARGEECGLERGLYCASQDCCLAEDPSDDNSTLRCYQDCSAGRKCDKGTCTLLGDTIARCI